jgi:hypothetical protein
LIAVLTYHTNGGTCGTARFNLKLARELGVPCYQVETPGREKCQASAAVARHHECSLWRIKATWEAFDLFLHEWTEETGEWLQSITRCACLPGMRRLPRRSDRCGLT